MIIIDQPMLAKHLAEQLREFEFVKIVGQHANPYDGLKHIKSTKIDVVFLNIEMSLLNGLSVAEHLKSDDPSIHVVFVTQYHHYAVQAFEINALDYLMQPIRRNRLKNTLSRIYPQPYKEKRANNIHICCFGSLRIKFGEKNHPMNIRWRTRKTGELFAYLLLNHNKNVRKDFLVDLLWPHIGWQRGISQLYSAVYQMRKTLNELNINIEIESCDQHYILHLNNIKLDIEKWEQSIDNLSEINERTISEHMQTIYQYKGDIFRDLNYAWSVKEKDRLRETWLYHIGQVTKYLFERGKFIQIINIYHHVQDAYPTGTESYEMLMKLYAYMNNYGAVAYQYKALKKMLADEFDTEPSLETQNWYNQWRNNKAVYLESIKNNYQIHK